jgi:predicted DNA-binding protein with PD1-like motif
MCEKSIADFRRSGFLAASALMLIAVTPAGAYSQEPSTQYVAPAQAVPKGNAPGMKVQLLSAGPSIKEYAVIFSTGDEALSGLLAFAQKYHVTSAHFTAIGGLSRGTVAWFDLQRKMFRKIPIDSQVEVVAMIGDIALDQGKPVVHTHMVVATFDGTTRGGHVLEAYVSPTLEVMVTVDPIAMRKRLYPETGLSLIDPGLNAAAPSGAEINPAAK